MRFSRFGRRYAAAVEAMRLDVGCLRLQPLPGAAAVSAHSLEPHADLGEVDALASQFAWASHVDQRLEEE